MKTIVNKTTKPIKVPLSGGKVLHLGPLKTGQIGDQASEAPAILRLIESGAIGILGAGSPRGGDGRDETNERPASQGHRPETMSHRRGNR